MKPIFFLSILFVTLPAAAQNQTDLDLAVLPVVTGSGGPIFDTGYLRHHRLAGVGRIEFAGHLHFRRDWHTINSQNFYIPIKNLEFFSLGLEELNDSKSWSVQTGARIKMTSIPWVNNGLLLIFEDLSIGRYWKITGENSQAQQFYLGWHSNSAKLGKITLNSEGFLRTPYVNGSVFSEILVWTKIKNKWPRWSFGVGWHGHEGQGNTLVGIRYNIGKMHSHE